MATTASPSKIILTTGSNRGIGYGIAQRLARQAPAGDASWTIILACRTKQSADETVQKLRAEQKESHATLEAMELDLKSDESIIAARKEVEARFGRLDGT
jgi:NAD(P)-dependent dehydrogenase (short-subunit alcohol dehydrogenase family)